MNRQILSVLGLLVFAVNSLFASQTPIFSHFDVYMQNYNPAYVGLNSKRVSFMGGIGVLGSGPPTNFAFRQVSNNTDIFALQPVFRSNYVNVNFSTNIKLDDVPVFGFGLSYTNTDLEFLETANTAVMSFSYISHVLEGRIQAGINVKNNEKFIASRRIYKVYWDNTYTIGKLQEHRGNMDIGVMYSNDSNTFNAGFAVNNVFRENYELSTQDNVYQLYSNRKAQLIAIAGLVNSIGKKRKWENNALLVVNSDISNPDYILKSTISGARYGAGLLVQRQYRHFYAGPVVRYTSKHIDVIYSLKVAYFLDNLNNLSELGIVIR